MTLVFPMGASEKTNLSPQFAQLRTYNHVREPPLKSTFFFLQTFLFLFLRSYFYLYFIRKFQNEKGVDAEIYWKFLCLNALISHGINLAVLTIHTFSQLSLSLSLIANSDTWK